VVEEAEAIEASLWKGLKVIPQAEHSDTCSVPLVVLDLLSSAHISWVLPADIPMLVSFLETPAGEESEGWERFDAYWEGIDMGAREQESNALYFGKAPNAE
jgi:hypothetical protein